jgi:hypothetical protein
MSINRNEATALREQRTKAHAHMSSLLQKEQTPEIRGQVQRVINDINAMTEKITKTENPGAYVPATPYCSDEEVRHTAAFDRFVRGGLDNLTPEQRSLIQSKRDPTLEPTPISAILCRQVSSLPLNRRRNTSARSTTSRKS